MAFLSLSKSDPDSRIMLQRAVRARYGLRPVAVESIRLTMEGQGDKLLGFLPLKQHVTLLLNGSRQRTWESVSNLWGISVRRETRIFPQVSATPDPDQDLLRRLAWAEMAFMVTPLTMEGVTLRKVAENEFEAFQDSLPDNIVRVKLAADDSISVQTEHNGQTIALSGQGTLQTLDGFTVPTTVVYQRSGASPEVFAVVKAEVNPTT